MSINLVLIASIFILCIIILLLFFIKRERISLKYGIIWLLLFGFLFILLLIPGVLIWMTHLLGFEVSSNMIFSMLIGTLVIINISLTMIVSSQDKKIRLLIQEVSMLKK